MEVLTHLCKPLASTRGTLSCLPTQICIRGSCGFSAQTQAVNPGVSPLLLRCARAVSGTPSGHSTVVTLLHQVAWDSCLPSDSGNSDGIWEALLPAGRVGGCACLYTLIRLERAIRPCRSRVLLLPPRNFCSPAAFRPRIQASEILGRPQHCLWKR